MSKDEGRSVVVQEVHRLIKKMVDDSWSIKETVDVMFVHAIALAEKCYRGEDGHKTYLRNLLELCLNQTEEEEGERR